MATERCNSISLSARVGRSTRDACGGRGEETCEEFEGGRTEAARVTVSNRRASEGRNLNHKVWPLERPLPRCSTLIVHEPCEFSIL